MKTLFSISLFLLLTASIRAQPYSIDWYKAAGGGRASTGGTFPVSCTIGRPEANSAITGGSYFLTGGFWSLISMIQTVGLRNLTLAHQGSSAIVSWPDKGNYTSQQNSNLAASDGWITSSHTTSPSNGTTMSVRTIIEGQL